MTVKKVATTKSRKGAFKGAVKTASVVALGGLLLSGCAANQQIAGAGQAVAPKPAPQAAPRLGNGGVVKIGAPAQVALLAPMSAPRSDARRLAKSLSNAAELALRDLPGATAAVKVYDTKGTADGAALAARKAAQDGASVIIGPVFSHSVRAAQPVAAEAGLTMLSFSNDTAAAGGNVFLLGFLVGDEIDRVTSYAAAKGMTKLGALAPQNKLGNLGMRAFEESASRNGVEIAAVERYPMDFAGIEKATRRYADAHKQQTTPIKGVLLSDHGQSLQSAAAFLAYYNVSPTKTKFFGPGVWKSSTTLKENALRGGWFAGPDPRVVEQFAVRYEAAFGEKPHNLGSLGYDAMSAIGVMVADARARRDNTPFSPQDVATPAGFVGVNGVFRLQPNGLNERGLAVMEVQQGGFAVIDPAPAGFAGN